MAIAISLGNSNLAVVAAWGSRNNTVAASAALGDLGSVTAKLRALIVSSAKETY